MPIDGLTWRLDESEVEDLAMIVGSLATIEASENGQSFQVLLDAFNLTHMANLPSFLLLHVLFTVIEMLFDGLPDSIGLSTDPYERSLAAARLWATQIVDPRFVRLLEHDLRKVRNAVVHHS